MSNYLCNSCQGTYFDPQPDGSGYFHACPPGFGDRDENLPAGVVVLDGKVGRLVVNPNDANDVKFVEQPEGRKHEGAGRTKI